MVKSALLQRAGASAIREILEITEQPHVISLAGGLPNPATFPVAALEQATAHVLATDPTAALQYGPTEGYRPLRAWVAERAGLGQGDAGIDHVQITTGSQQALDLLARGLVDPGQTVALADPAYIGALQAFRAAGADLAAIPSDADGLRVDVLAERIARGLRPQLVYVVANFDNPTGATLSAERRRALAALADRHGFWIVDDDPYGDLRWTGSAPVALRDLTDRVITLGSTSKVLAPGLRVGWAVAPPEVRRALTVLKQSADLHTSSLTQQLVHRVLTGPGFLVPHLDLLRSTYRDQAQQLAASLRRHLGDRISFAEPAGGMFLWAELRDHHGDPVDTTALLPRAVEAGVAYVPGSAFAVVGERRSALRLSYATASGIELDHAAQRLLGAATTA